MIKIAIVIRSTHQKPVEKVTCYQFVGVSLSTLTLLQAPLK